MVNMLLLFYQTPRWFQVETQSRMAFAKTSYLWPWLGERDNEQEAENQAIEADVQGCELRDCCHKPK